MNRKVLFVALLSVATVFGASAQKISGNLSPLKGQEKVNVVLDFSGTLVNGASEESYIAKETKGKSEADKEKWLEEWNTNLRSNAYGLFTKELNDRVSKNFFTAGDFADAGCTIIVKVKDITTGMFAGPFSKPSAIKADVNFVKTGETTPFATVEFKKSTSAFSTEMPHLVTRITMSFGSLGMELGVLLSKALR